jgi:hypothetical protein
MTSTDAQPDLVSGLPAQALARAFVAPLWTFFALDAFFALSQVVTPVRAAVLDPYFVVFAVVGGLDVVAAVLIALLSRRAQTRESAAGYTTLWRQHPTLPQLDSRSGAVIRAAGEPYRKRSDWRREPGGTESQIARRPSILRRVLPYGASLLVFAAFGIALSTQIDSERRSSLAWIPWAITAIVIVIVLSNVIAALFARARLARLRGVAPNEFVFDFSSSADFRIQSLAMVGAVEPPTGHVGVSANSVGLTFWHGSPLAIYAALPWSSVVSVQADVAKVANSSVPAVLLSYRDEAEDIQLLPLAGANTSLFQLRNMPEARWIASELDQLRTGTTSARLI